ncbi:MAG: S-adenosylmethionine:tRNA ribosyltransferase-isomerase [Sciscionella sp.]
MSVLEFALPAELEAHEPPEARGVSRDAVRLLVGRSSTGVVTHHRFSELPALLRPADVLVVNTSATLPAAVAIPGGALRVHFSTERTDGRWLVELRRTSGKTSEPYPGGEPGQRLPLPGGGAVTLRERYSRQRLWVADISVGEAGSVRAFLQLFGEPIRYSYVPGRWPISAYQTVFGAVAGSAEMPSASRPFTDRLVTRLVSAGVQFAPLLLHTGVASAQAQERPYPERFSVPQTSARTVNQAKAAGGRVIAIGTTAVRALESATGDDGVACAASGWTELIITPERGVRVVDGLLTGFHEPRASHLDMLAAISDRTLLQRCYHEAIAGGYLWHEFGDVNLLLP